MRRTALLLAALAALAMPCAAHAAAPQISYTLTGQAAENGWWSGPVGVHWTVSNDATSSTCPIVETISTDTTGTTRGCTATNGDGTSSLTTKVISIDQTPPTNVTATPARAPDYPPFYTAPVAITWSAADATSGVASCTTITYNGPDAASASPQGSCRDRAGNVTAPFALTFAYDATAPPLSGVTATAQPDRSVTLGWTTDADAATVTVTRQPGNATILDAVPAATTRAATDGPLAASTTYTYTVAVRDGAGHVTSATAAATTPAAAEAKSARAGASKRPTIRWSKRRGALYYNLQLFRNGRKLLSAWPKANRYTLRASWRFKGHRHKLAAGRYRVYVWPGYGPRAAHRYGRLIISRVVRVR